MRGSARGILGDDDEGALKAVELLVVARGRHEQAVGDARRVDVLVAHPDLAGHRSAGTCCVRIEAALAPTAGDVTGV